MEGSGRRLSSAGASTAEDLEEFDEHAISERTMGRRTGTSVAALAATVMLAGTGGDAFAQEETFRWSDRMASSATLEVRGISGDVRATLAEGATAEVVATKRGDRDDFEEVEILVLEEEGGVVVCAVYGASRSRDRCDHDGDRDRWDDRWDDNLDVRVDFEVRVPAGVGFHGATVAGDVVAEGLRSDVTGRTVSGNVYLVTSGSAWGATVSGDLDLEMGRLDPDRMRFKTVSGDITLRIPEGLDLDVAFESLSGDFRSDFDGRFEREDGRWVGNEVWGSIGSGGPRLSLQTVSGDARLVRARR